MLRQKCICNLSQWEEKWSPEWVSHKAMDSLIINKKRIWETLDQKFLLLYFCYRITRNFNILVWISNYQIHLSSSSCRLIILWNPLEIACLSDFSSLFCIQIMRCSQHNLRVPLPFSGLYIVLKWIKSCWLPDSQSFFAYFSNFFTKSLSFYFKGCGHDSITFADICFPSFTFKVRSVKVTQIWSKRNETSLRRILRNTAILFFFLYLIVVPKIKSSAPCTLVKHFTMEL